MIQKIAHELSWISTSPVLQQVGQHCSAEQAEHTTEHSESWRAHKITGSITLILLTESKVGRQFCNSLEIWSTFGTCIVHELFSQMHQTC